MDSTLLTFEGCNYFRQRLVLATLSCRPVKISKIREHGEDIGLREFEAGFIRLLDKLTNGSRIEVDVTGTSVFYYPGLLIGGSLDHDCSRQRSIGYFLEPLMMLAPFAKKPVHITLRGLTNGPLDPSVDYYRMCVLPMLKKMLPDDGLELKLRRRGVWPEGSGEVFFSCPVVKTMRPLQLTDEGRVRRVRGMAHCLRVSPAMANRMVDSARAVLNNYLPDVYIYTDTIKGIEAGKSPGYGMTLVSESTSGVMHSAEGSTHITPSSPRKQGEEGDEEKKSGKQVPTLPEDIGKQTAVNLIEEIVKGGCVDSGCQIIPLLFMALGHKDISKIQLGELTTYIMQFLRHMREFFQLTYKIESKEEDLQEMDSEHDLGFRRQIVVLSCVGVGYSNFSKGIK